LTLRYSSLEHTANQHIEEEQTLQSDLEIQPASELMRKDSPRPPRYGPYITW